MTEPKAKPKTFTLWVAHPDRWDIANDEESVIYASRTGWWRTDWTGNEAEAEALRERLQDRAA